MKTEFVISTVSTIGDIAHMVLMIVITGALLGMSVAYYLIGEMWMPMTFFAGVTACRSVQIINKYTAMDESND